MVWKTMWFRHRQLQGRTLTNLNTWLCSWYKHWPPNTVNLSHSQRSNKYTSEVIIKFLSINNLDATFWLSCMTKATLLLLNTERLIDLCPLGRVLDHNFTVVIDYVCSANPTIKKNKRKSKHCLKNNTTLRSLKGGQKMSV